MVHLNFDVDNATANTEGLVDYLVVVSDKRGVDMSRLSRVDGVEVLINNTSLHNKRLPPQPSKISEQRHVEALPMGDHARKPVLTADMLSQVAQATLLKPECVIDRTNSKNAVVTKVFSVRAVTRDGQPGPEFMVSPGSSEVYPGPVVDEATLRNQMYNDMAYAQIQRGILARQEVSPQTIRDAVYAYNKTTAAKFDQYTRGVITMTDRFNAQADAMEIQQEFQQEIQGENSKQMSLPGIGSDEGKKQPKNTVADRVANMRARNQELRFRKEAEVQGQQILF